MAAPGRLVRYNAAAIVNYPYAFTFHADRVTVYNRSHTQIMIWISGEEIRYLNVTCLGANVMLQLDNVLANRTYEVVLNNHRAGAIPFSVQQIFYRE